MRVTQKEIEALLQRYRKLPAEVQQQIDAMVEQMLAGLDPNAEWRECARRLWRAIFTLEIGNGEEADDADASQA
jgi:hypothetical protein